MKLLVFIVLLSICWQGICSNCYNRTNCMDCVGSFFSPVSSDCLWCNHENYCISSDDRSVSCTDTESQCKEPLYSIIIISAFVLMTFCCLLCCLRNMKSSLFKCCSNREVETEWMCIICGFDNTSKSGFCVMCGTSRQFTTDYKTEKNKEKEEKKKKMKLSPADIKIPFDEQLSQSSIHAADVLSNVLTPDQRAKLFNFRRLNQLTLRQKSARRRKMWQRVRDPETGVVQWLRCPVSETKVGGALFGYSPSSSVDEFEASRRVPVPVLGRPDRSDSSADSIIISALHAPKTRRKKHDSFDDVIMSGSPGYTSVFGDGGELQWEKVETGNAASINITAPPDPSVLHSPPPTSRSISHFDLQEAAILTFGDKHKWFLNHLSSIQQPWSSGFVRFEIHRDKLLHDSCKCMNKLHKADLRKWLRIQFTGESGVDAGGIEREWFALVTAEILDPNNGLFIPTASELSADVGSDPEGGRFSFSDLSGTVHINPLSSRFHKDHLEYFHFAGRFFGKGILEQQSIDAPLSLPLRKQILTLPITFSDLEFVDSELYKNLKWLQTHDNVESLCLDFTTTYRFTPSNGKTVSITSELKPGGENIAVTDANKHEYLQLKLKHRILDSVKPQLEAFLRGLYEVIPGDLLSVFDYQELDLLMCGTPEINLDDWKQNTEYLGDFSVLEANHRVIRWFWQAVEAFTNEERVRLLQFTTGCSRLPTQGFKALQSNNGTYRRYNIQSVPKSVSMYPRAHTCFNKLDLPLYESKAELEAYLSVVVDMESYGFTMD